MDVKVNIYLPKQLFATAKQKKKAQKGKHLAHLSRRAELGFDGAGAP